MILRFFSCGRDLKFPFKTNVFNRGKCIYLKTSYSVNGVTGGRGTREELGRRDRRERGCMTAGVQASYVTGRDSEAE